MKRLTLAIVVVLSTACLSGAAYAQDSEDAGAESQGSYAEHYSLGMQAYVDGDYEAAVDMFHRAYGLNPKPVVARLIVRSYDFIGACDAAGRQHDFYRSEHPDERRVDLQRCADPARVQVNCGDVDAPVKVDEELRGRCGETIALPAGRHTFTSPALDTPTTVELDAGETREVSLAVDPEKWPSPDSTDQPRKWKDGRVGRGGDLDRDDFSVYQSRDGLYRVWVRYDLLKDPDMHSGDSDAPRVLRLCDVDQRYDDNEENCVPLEPLQIDKVD